jgi:hypothetical protein
MSAEDPHWGPPVPPPKPKKQRPPKPAKPTAAQPAKKTPDPEGHWDGSDHRPEPPRPWLGWLGEIPYEKAGAVAIALVATTMAALAVIERPAPPRASPALPPRLVVARVAVARGDARSLDQVCASFDLPYRVCSLSQDCANALAARTPPSEGGGRSLNLILRSNGTSCASEIEAHRAPD